MKGLRYISRSHAPEPAARISRIRLHPFSTDDHVTIGLAAEDGTGRHFLRYLDNNALSRINCLVDDAPEFGWVLEQLKKAAESRWDNLEELGTSISSFILTLSPPEPYHMPIDQQRFDMLFRSIVALSAKEKVDRTFKPRNREDIRNEVFGKIRQLAGLEAERIILETPLVLDPNRPPIEIDLMDNNHAGAILSAWYVTPATIETGFLRGYMDVECAVRARKLAGGLFLLRPEEYPGIGASRVEEIDSLLDRLSWKAARSGMKVEIETETDTLAKNIVEWIRK